MPKIKIGIIGYGSVGKQLFNTLLENGYEVNDLYIFADDVVSDKLLNTFGFNDYKLPQFAELRFIPALGYLSKNLKYEILEYLSKNGKDMFSFIHPTAFISKNAKIGRGVIIYSMCNVDQGAVVDDGTILLNSCIVAHDTHIGKCVYLAPGVCLSGFINVGDLSFIGTGATIANNVDVGKGSIIAIGTCLTKSIAENSFVIGNPFKHKKNISLT